jgi:hypothetical protein
LNLDDQLGILQLLGQPDMSGLQFAVLFGQWADNHFWTALLGVRASITLCFRCRFQVVRCEE